MWIPVTKGLPEANQTVIIWSKRLRHMRPVTFILCSDGQYFWDNKVDDLYQPSEVQYWMSFPEPPNAL